MKRMNLVGPAIAVGFLGLGLVACQDFDKGDSMHASVARVQGDPCRVSIAVRTQPGAPGRVFTARLETPECNKVLLAPVPYAQEGSQ